MFINREAQEAHRDLMEAIEERCGEPLCAQTDPELFFPEKGGSVVEAKKLCRQCPVQTECLIFAVLNAEMYGVFGGLSAKERSRLRRQSPEAMAQHLRAPEMQRRLREQPRRYSEHAKPPRKSADRA
jgi:hypothetical protein